MTCACFGAFQFYKESGYFMFTFFKSLHFSVLDSSFGCENLLQKNKRTSLLNWPRCSSDLSLTENIWCVMKWEMVYSWNPFWSNNRKAFCFLNCKNCSQMLTECCKKAKRWWSVVVNMPLSQLFCDITYVLHHIHFQNQKKCGKRKENWTKTNGE